MAKQSKDSKEKDKSKPTDREKKYKKKVAQEYKKLQKLTSSPGQSLFYLSLIVGLLTFINSYFSNTSELVSAILTAFYGFSICFIGVGVGIVLFFHFKSEMVKKSYEEKLRKEQEFRERLEKEKYNSELSEIEQIEKELSHGKAGSKPDSKKKVSSAKSSSEEDFLDEVLNSNFNL